MLAEADRDLLRALDWAIVSAKRNTLLRVPTATASRLIARSFQSQKREILAGLLLRGLHEKYDPNEKRDTKGRWTAGASTPLKDPTTYSSYADDPFLDPFVIDQKYPNMALSPKIGAPQLKDRAEKLISRALSSDNVRWEKWVAHIDDTLGRAYLRDPDEIAHDIVRGWAETSGDHSDHALAMQYAAAQEFGIPGGEARVLAKFKSDRPTIAGVERFKKYAEAMAPMNRVALRAIYDETQKQLAAENITSVTLFRGLMLDPKTKGIDSLLKKSKGVVAVSGHPLQSWSTSATTAEMFANGYGTDDGIARSDPRNGRVLVAKFPADRIFSTARSGVGSLDEREYVVLDGLGKAFMKMTAMGERP